MSKRGAEEYITKDHGSFQQGPNSEKPQMASAAAMATRKTATPRGRLNRAGTPQRRFPPSANASAPNPFASMQQNTFGAVGNGVVFGGGAQDNTNNNNAPQTGGFTFSANSTSGNNPFASANSNPFANTNGTPNFGGQNNQNTEDESMDTGSPIKKRTRTENSTNMFGGFGQNSSDATSKAPSFGGFGQSQTAQSNTNPFGSLFGASSSTSESQTPAPTSNLFGSQSTASNQQTSTPAFSFGQPQNQTQSKAEQQPAKPSFGFGQQSTTASTPAQQTTTAGSLFGFGQSTQSAPASQPANPTFSFGSGLNANAQSTAAQTSTPAFSFGASQAPSTSVQQTPSLTNSLFGGNQFPATTAANSPLVFGAPTTQSDSQAQTPKPTTSLFGASTPATTAGQSPAKPTFSFGQPAQTAQDKQQSAAPATTGFQFGQTSTSTSTAEQPKPSFSGFSFGQSQTSAPSAESPAVTSDGNKSMFSGAQNASQPTAFSFGGAPTTSADKDTSSAPAFSTPKQSAFSNLSGAQSEQPKKSALFGQTPSAKPAMDVAPATTGKPTFSFGQPAGSPSKGASDADEASKTNMFAGLFASGQSTSLAPASKTAAPSFFGAPQQGNDAPPTASGLFGSQPPSSGGLFTPSPVKSAPPPDMGTKKDSNDSATNIAPKKSLFGTLSQPAPAGVEQVAASTTPDPTPEVTSEPKDLMGVAKTATPSAGNANVPTQRAVYTKSPSRMPKFLNAEGFMEYDKNYRLRALNKEFQKQIATIDPDRSDFENLIRHYVAARSAIGGDMGLYQRTAAGTKRKTGEVEEETVPAQYKKPKISEPANSARGFTEAPAATKPTTPGKATSLFNNMIPDAEKSDNGPARGNPFGGVSFLPEGNDAAFKPGSSFSNNVMNAGSTPAAKKANFGQLSGSTTPMKSPPKNNLFGAPTNSASGFKKRKATSGEEDEVSSEDEGRKKRTRSSPSKFAAKADTPSKPVHSSFIVDDDDEDETDAQTGDDAEDGDFAPNADGSDDEDDSDDDNSQQASEEELGQTPQEDSETSGAPDDDHTDEINSNPNKGKSLFERMEPKPETTTAAKPKETSGGIKWPVAPSGLTPETPTFSPLTPGSKSPYKPATTFNFTPTPATKPAPTAGASVLAGGITNGKESKFSGMFGSRPSTPEPEKASSKAAPTSTPSDNTWKNGQDIKFGEGIKFTHTEASPAKSGTSTPFGSIFGTSTTPAPGFLSATTYLGAESGLSSVTSSRASSPGVTDNESVATNDTNDEEGGQAEAQQDLMNSNPGEENDDVLYASKAKALVIAKGERAKQLKIKENEWVSIGVGQLRLLKNRTSGRVRILLRSEPGANIVLNNYLESTVDYVVKDQNATQKSGAVSGAVVRDGVLDTVVFKVKDAEAAKSLAALMMKHRADGQ